MTIHNTPLSTSTEKSNLLTTMQDREAEVAKCVNELISYQQLEFAKMKRPQQMHKLLKPLKMSVKKH